MKRTITKEFQWDCAHRLHDPKLTDNDNKELYGLCNNIHGHTYKMFVTISLSKDSIMLKPNGMLEGKLDNGFVINFKDLKNIVKTKIVDVQDHALNLIKGDIIYESLKDSDMKINISEYVTSCENQVMDYWNMLENDFEKIGCQLEKIKLFETPTSYSTLKR